MGNTDSKAPADQETQKQQVIFKTWCHQKNVLNKDDVYKKWCSKVDQQVVDFICAVLFPSKAGLNFENFNEFATCITRGNNFEKSELILRIITCPSGDGQYVQLKNFLQAVLRSVIKMEQQLTCKAFLSWSGKCNAAIDFNRQAEYFIQQSGGKKTEYSSQDIIKILPTFDSFLGSVFGYLFDRATSPNSFFPLWTRLKNDVGIELNKCSILAMEDILILNQELPVDYQLEWRLLFSTKIHGESFSRLSGQMMNQGPTLLVIKDKDERVFGGFAPANWTLNPKFVGDSSSFLFSLKTHLDILQASNFNENYQYLNQGQQTLPNGLGFGGCLEYFGIWLDSEFGKGVCNDSCTTYRNFKRLSKEKEFLCSDVEVWGVGQPPTSAEERGERSVLDGNTEAKAIMELAGKKTYSDGLREEPKD